jgi:hypothetical protein
MHKTIDEKGERKEGKREMSYPEMGLQKKSRGDP